MALPLTRNTHNIMVSHFNATIFCPAALSNTTDLPASRHAPIANTCCVSFAVNQSIYLANPFSYLPRRPPFEKESLIKTPRRARRARGSNRQEGSGIHISGGERPPRIACSRAGWKGSCGEASKHPVTRGEATEAPRSLPGLHL